MTRARRERISLTDTPYYHCIARCVRRAFLCGVDDHTGQDFSHRRAWVLKRMQTLASMFAIDVCAYAIMSNHFHLVLKVNAVQARSWSLNEVIDRWQILFEVPELVQRCRTGNDVGQAESNRATKIVEEWRGRLHDISWYMRVLNEHIARLANAEDRCTGRFWEGRFHSQALLDEQAVLTCMAYVDLNPIRAQMAATPEESDFTSIQQRVSTFDAEHKRRRPAETATAPEYPLTHAAATTIATTEHGGIARPETLRCPLLHFVGWEDTNAGIPFREGDYLQLVDWAGRIVRPDKSGAISSDMPPILARLGIDDAEFLKYVGPKVSRQEGRRHTKPFPTAVGTPARMKAAATEWGRAFLRGVDLAKRLFPRIPAT